MILQDSTEFKRILHIANIFRCDFFRNVRNLFRNHQIFPKKRKKTGTFSPDGLLKSLPVFFRPFGTISKFRRLRFSAASKRAASPEARKTFHFFKENYRAKRSPQLMLLQSGSS